MGAGVGVEVEVWAGMGNGQWSVGKGEDKFCCIREVAVYTG